MHVTPTQTRRGRGWTLLIVCAAAYTLVMCIVVWNRAESGTDFRDFWRTARQFRETGVIRSDLGVHNYLPFFTIFMTPWSYLPLRPAAVLFTVLSLALLALSVVLAEVLLHGRVGDRPSRSMWISVGLMLPYATSCAVLGAMGHVLLFLTLASWFLVVRRREWLAGTTLGLAILIKLLPAVLVVYFLLQRRWRVAAASLVTVVVLGLGSPLALLGYQETAALHAGLAQRAFQAQSARTTIYAEQPIKANYSNVSLPIVLKRLLSPVNASKDETHLLRVNVLDLKPNAILVVYVLAMLLLVVPTIAVSLRTGVGRDESGGEGHLEFGLWCCLMVLCSPLVWTHYLPLVYWPLAVLSAISGLKRFSRARWTLLCWLVCAVLLVSPAARAAGAPLLCVIVVWAGLLALRVSSDSTIPRTQ